MEAVNDFSIAYNSLHVNAVVREGEKGIVIIQQGVLSVERLEKEIFMKNTGEKPVSQYWQKRLLIC